MERSIKHSQPTLSCGGNKSKLNKWGKTNSANLHSSPLSPIGLLGPPTVYLGIWGGASQLHCPEPQASERETLLIHLSVPSKGCAQCLAHRKLSRVSSSAWVKHRLQITASSWSHNLTSIVAGSVSICQQEGGGGSSKGITQPGVGGVRAKNAAWTILDDSLDTPGDRAGWMFRA